MIIISSMNDTRLNCSSVALGTFDGLHQGHIAVISNAVSFAETNSVASVVISVEKNEKKLLDFEDFKSELVSLGVDYLIQLNLEDIKNITAVDFFNEFLIKKVGAKCITCGFNYSFGKNAEGNAKLLQKLCVQNNINFNEIAPVKFNGEDISTSRIKKCLADGDIESAGFMLNKKIGFTSKVLKGAGLGHTLNTPTANIEIPDDRYIPRLGVYYATVSIGEKNFNSVCNIGCHPSAEKLKKPIMECFLFDCNKNLYSETVTVSLLKFKRAEQKFDNIALLTQAINNDKSDAEKYFAEMLEVKNEKL